MSRRYDARDLRSAIFAALDALQLPRLFLSDAPRILLYHGVTSAESEEVSAREDIFNYRGKFVRPDAFREQLTWLKRRFDIVPLATLLKEKRPGSLALTFDDGYRNNYTEAFPILRESGVPATFFVTTDFVERDMPLPVDIIEYALGTERREIVLDMDTPKTFSLASRKARIRADLAIKSYMKTLPADRAEAFVESVVHACGRDLRGRLRETPYSPMTWPQMREMESARMTFAPHTATHPILSRMPRERAREDIVRSRDALARALAHPLPVFAYPNGGKLDYSPETVGLLKECGFTAALTTEPRALGKDDSPYELPRFTMDGADDMHRARLMVSGVYSALT